MSNVLKNIVRDELGEQYSSIIHIVLISATPYVKVPMPAHGFKSSDWSVL